MCGIIGVSLDFITSRQLRLVERVIRESEIRGMHAYGLAWHDGVGLSRFAESKPISDALNEEPAMIEELVTIDNHLNMIAHTRYSTSDLDFNQPIFDKDLAIAHNGVISQSPAGDWETEFSLKVSTRNDSELILRALQNGENPIEKFPDASIAYVSINNWGDVDYARNGKRPLWVTSFRNGFIITSTKDIMLRASDGEHIPIMAFPMGDGEELQ